MSRTISVVQVDALLPQTQCGLCGYPGCLPYAQAIIENNVSHHHCVPGGQPVTDALSNLLGRERLAVVPSRWEIAADGRPQSIRAKIREAECIGCTKCITACPVDAIIGSGKMMHSIIEDLCTGCELCIAPCPVDCIDLYVVPSPAPSERPEIEVNLRKRFNARLKRDNVTSLSSNSNRKPTLAVNPFAQIWQDMGADTTPSALTAPTLDIQSQAQDIIAMAAMRNELRKLKRQYQASPDNSTLAQKIEAIEHALKGHSA